MRFLRFALVASFLLSLARFASAGGLTTRASAEVAGYQDSVSVSVLTPNVGVGLESPTGGWALSGRYLVDVVTAASPDIVSTASPKWIEVRQAGNVGFRFKPDTTGFAVNAAISRTPDYLSFSGGATFLKELDEKNWSLSAGYNYGHDTIGRTGTSFSTFSRELEYHTATASIARTVSPSVLLSLTADAIFERGDQSKPYRYIPMFESAVARTIPAGASTDVVAKSRISARPLEQLPLERDRYALTGRLAFRSKPGTLRIEERIYTDTWELHASTTDVRFMFDVSERVILWPHLRGHVQTAVNFWERAYSASSAADLPSLRTGDRELGALVTLGGGGGVRWAVGPAGEIDRVILSLSVDGYWTSFADTLYVKERFAGLSVFTLESKF